MTAAGRSRTAKSFFQVKATDRLRRSAGGKTIPFRVARTDLTSWLGEPMPVILVVYDARAERAYWLYVQAEFEKRRGDGLARGPRTVTVRLPRAQRLSTAAVGKFVGYKEAVLAQQLKLVHHA